MLRNAKRHHAPTQQPEAPCHTLRSTVSPHPLPGKSLVAQHSALVPKHSRAMPLLTKRSPHRIAVFLSFSVTPNSILLDAPRYSMAPARAYEARQFRSDRRVLTS